MSEHTAENDARRQRIDRCDEFTTELHRLWNTPGVIRYDEQDHERMAWIVFDLIEAAQAEAGVNVGGGIKPYYAEGGVTIYHADCRDVLLGIPFDSVDLLLTDPPYGINFKVDKGGRPGGQFEGETSTWTTSTASGPTTSRATSSRLARAATASARTPATPSTTSR